MNNAGDASDSSALPGLRTQIRADLEWLLSCPDLLASDLNLDLRQFSLPLDFDPTPVEDFLTGNCRYRLGYYFESLVQILLESDDSVTDLQHGIQIRESGTTLGEIDFLFRRGGARHHLEVALKFYLHSPETEVRGSHLLGPNARDNFERKRDHLYEKQIPLGKKRFADVRTSQLLVKGAIFYPWRHAEPCPSVEGLSRNHRRGFWITDGQLNDFLSTLASETRGRILKKPFWLSGRIKPEREVDPFAELAEKIARIRRETQKPMLFSVGDERQDGWRETHRIFVVHENWPAG